MGQKALITGGAGYIGSTIASRMLDEGMTPIILDNLSVGPRVFTEGRIFYEGDIADKALLERIFAEHPEISGCIHCAARIIVPESVEMPYEYYRENVAKSVELYHNLHELGCDRIIFSSSASLYDKADDFRVTEESPLAPESPYARTKFMMEMVLRDFCAAYNMRGIALRYFNPIGADPKMRSGLHARFPSLVIGKLVDTVNGKQEFFTLTGTDWPTRDGSGIRDYIYVWDLAGAHVLAMKNFDQVFERAGNPADNYLVINLGTGNGTTVKELVTAFEKVYGKKVPLKVGPPRPGDVAGAYTSSERASQLLGWEASTPLEQGIATALEWGSLRKERLGYE